MWRKLKITIRKPKATPADKAKSDSVMKRQQKKRSYKS